MLALAGAVVAGVLTTLAPCVLPLLPVIVGGSVAGAQDDRVRRAVVIATSLGVSIVAFTLLLRATTAFIGIPDEVWSVVAGGVLIALGLVMTFPAAWDRVAAAASLQARTSRGLAAATERGGVSGEVLTGAALGPVFSSCSPLYGYVVVTVIPADLAYGIALLLAYAVGLCGTLLAVALLGQRLVRRLGWLADPHGVARRLLGLVVVAVGVMVLFGWDRDLQTWVIENSPVRPWELDQGFIPE